MWEQDGLRDSPQVLGQCCRPTGCHATTESFSKLFCRVTRARFSISADASASTNSSLPRPQWRRGGLVSRGRVLTDLAHEVQGDQFVNSGSKNCLSRPGTARATQTEL